MEILALVNARLDVSGALRALWSDIDVRAVSE